MKLPQKQGFTTYRMVHGFTLIELLVVISIIAVLSVMGAAIFSGLQKGARDSRRKADVDAITKVLEVNRSSSGYIAPLDTNFASGKIPYDPVAASVSDNTKTGCGTGTTTENKCWYCFRAASTGSFSYCNTATDYRFSAGDLTPLDGSGTGASGGWIVCANLESGTPAYYCKKSAQ